MWPPNCHHRGLGNGGGTFVANLRIRSKEAVVKHTSLQSWEREVQQSRGHTTCGRTLSYPELLRVDSGTNEKCTFFCCSLLSVLWAACTNPMQPSTLAAMLQCKILSVFAYFASASFWRALEKLNFGKKEVIKPLWTPWFLIGEMSNDFRTFRSCAWHGFSSHRLVAE